MFIKFLLIRLLHWAIYEPNLIFNCQSHSHGLAPCTIVVFNQGLWHKNNVRLVWTMKIKLMIGMIPSCACCCASLVCHRSRLNALCFILIPRPLLWYLDYCSDTMKRNNILLIISINEKITIYILIVLHQDPALLPIIKPNYLQTRKQIINGSITNLLPIQCWFGCLISAWFP